MMRTRIALLFLILSVGFLPRAGAQTKEEFNVREHYTKYEYRIPMRDGVHLFTSVYVPKDTSVAYPFLMDRTPYSVGPYGEDQYRTSLGPSEAFERSGYIFVFQDVRGRYMSEGKFVEMHPHIDEKHGNKDVDDSSDTYDTIEWLLHNVPNNNSSVGIWGVSYNGFYTSASIIDSHPALKAASPQAPMTDLFMGDDAYHGGAFMLDANFGFYSSFKPLDNPTPPKAALPFDFGTHDGYEFYLKMGPLANANTRYFHNQTFLWIDQLSHNTYDDYWKARNLAPHLKNIHCAVLTVGGWFDAEDLYGPFRVFRSLEQNDPGIYNGLVEGP
ncbi:MAG: CocE/NonD family hydrolase, partial [Terriglobia bacterium]